MGTVGPRLCLGLSVALAVLIILVITRSSGLDNESRGIMPYKQHKFVFVGGLRMSGTAVIERLLSSQWNIASGLRIEETDIHDRSSCISPHPHQSTRCQSIENEGNFVTKVFLDLYKERGVACDKKPANNALGRCSNLMHLTELDVEKFHGESRTDANPGSRLEAFREKLFLDWQPFWNTSRSFLIESDEQNLVRSRFLQALLRKTETYFIFVIRHPMATCPELQCDIDSHMKRWVYFNQMMIADLKNLQRYVVLHHEALIEHTTEVIDALKELLDWELIDFDDHIRPADQANRNKKHNIGVVNSGRAAENGGNAIESSISEVAPDVAFAARKVNQTPGHQFIKQTYTKSPSRQLRHSYIEEYEGRFRLVRQHTFEAWKVAYAATIKNRESGLLEKLKPYDSVLRKFCYSPHHLELNITLCGRRKNVYQTHSSSKQHVQHRPS